MKSVALKLCNVRFKMDNRVLHLNKEFDFDIALVVVDKLTAKTIPFREKITSNINRRILE